ncbi:Golgi apparatus protein 1, partial [Haematococcus lacustris]
RGNGAAQACLEQYLSSQGSAPEPEGQGKPGKAGTYSGLSPPCAAALFKRQVEESEDIRFNFRLSAACAGDKSRFCPELRPGQDDVVGCLEHHAGSPEFSEECQSAIERNALLRATDVRLDARFRAVCHGDVHALCFEEEAQILSGPLQAPPGEGTRVMDCMRRSRERIRSLPCRQHPSPDGHVALLDPEPVWTHPGPAQRPAQRPAGPAGHPASPAHFLEAVPTEPARGWLFSTMTVKCTGSTRLAAGHRLEMTLAGWLVAGPLRGKRGATLPGPLRGPSVLEGRHGQGHKVLEPECMEAVRERSRQAAADIRFLPTLSAACGSELRSLCTSPDLSGPAVLDCLADNRNRPEFSVGCRTALVDFLADAVSDVRMLHSLKQDCSHDITTLCSGVDAGKGGGVLACLQQKRADISGKTGGLQAPDTALAGPGGRGLSPGRDQQADVQQYCGGVKADSGSFAGAVHTCLRKSWEHLSPGCRRAEQALELAEHEDVRLNPRIQRDCPLAIKQFCDSVPAGNANVLSCLQSASSKPSFPQDCKSAIDKLLERAHAKYSLNIKLKAACDPDVAQMCPGASDEPQRVSDPGILGCLAANSSALSAPCRVELAALVHVHLDRYRIGMPLTSPCDGDVMARCNVDKQVTPFLMGGYVQACLSRHAAALHKPCWALISMFDERQYQAATVLEAKHWTADLQKEALDKMTAQVHAALEQHSGAMKPMMSALMNALLAIMAGLVVMAWYVWRRLRNTSVVKPRTIAIKDGRV